MTYRKVIIMSLMVIAGVVLSVLGVVGLLGGLDEAVRVAPLASTLLGGCALAVGVAQYRRATSVREARAPDLSTPEAGGPSVPLGHDVVAPSVGPVRQSVKASVVGGSVVQIGHAAGNATVG